MSGRAPLRRHVAGAAAVFLALAACSSHGGDAATIAPDDQRQLNDAAAMLDANSVDANALDDHESSPHD